MPPIDSSAETRAARLATLEERIKNLDEKVDERHEENKRKLDKVSTQVAEIRELIANAKGAKWVIVGLVSLALSGWLHKILAFLGKG